MSFNRYKRPKLIDGKLLEFFEKKYKEEDLKDKINEENTKQTEITINPNWYDKYLDQTKNFIKENYGFVIISTLIIILLYVRYIEVKKRKKKLQELIK